MDKVVKEEGVVQEHYAAFETVAFLEQGVAAVYGTEGPAALILYRAHPVGQPSYPDAVTGHEVGDIDGLASCQQGGFSLVPGGQEGAEFIPMPAFDVAAEDIECPGLDGGVAFEFSPDPPEGVFGDVLACRIFNLEHEVGEVAAAFDLVSELLLDRRFEGSDLGYL